jgi:hypothetical protein
VPSRYKQISDEVLAELRSVGLALTARIVTDIELIDLTPDAARLLVRWLDRLPMSDLDERHNLWLSETFTRALTDRAARGVAAPALLRRFRADFPGPNHRWVIGAALDTVADAAVIDEMLDLAADARYGRDRQEVLHALGRLAKSRGYRDRAIAVLVGALNEEDVAAHAIVALTRLRAVEAVPDIERYLTAGPPIARKEARRALKILTSDTQPTEPRSASH